MSFTELTPKKINFYRTRFHELALDIVRESGIGALTVKELSERAGVPKGSFCYITGESFTSFKRRVIDEEVLRFDLENPQKNQGRVKLDGVLARRRIVVAAVELSKNCGYINFKMRDVAHALNTSANTLSNHFTISKLRDAVIDYAIENEITLLIAQAIVQEHPHVDELPCAVRRKAIAELSAAKELLKAKESRLYKEKKQRILNAAIAIINRDGEKNITRQQVAAAANMDRTTTYSYYPDFDRLIDYAVRKINKY